MLVSIPIWIAEIAPSRTRGALVSVHVVLILLGRCLATWIAVTVFPEAYVPIGSLAGASFNYDNPRTLLGIACIWPFLCIVSALFVPESPRYLLLKGREHAAWEIVMNLHSTPNGVNNQSTQQEFEQMGRQINVERNSPNDYKQLFTKKPFAKRVLIACGLSFFVASCGSAVEGLFTNLLHSTRSSLTYL